MEMIYEPSHNSLDHDVSNDRERERERERERAISVSVNYFYQYPFIYSSYYPSEEEKKLYKISIDTL